MTPPDLPITLEGPEPAEPRLPLLVHLWVYASTSIAAGLSAAVVARHLPF